MGPLRVMEAGAAASAVLRGQLSRYGAGGGASQSARLERAFVEYLDVPHARLVNSGTSALVCALVGLRVGPGDEVLVPAYTWISTAAAVLAVGAVPVLVEIDESLTMDPDDAEAKLTEHTKAILVVHMLNHVCDLDRLVELSERTGVALVEDACQAIGVRYHGRPVGSFGAAGAFSFNDHKNMRSGEGGLVLLQDETAFVRASMFHDVGSFIRPDRIDSDEPVFVGMNLKASELTAAVLRPQLRSLDRQIDRRRARRRMMLDELSSVPGLRVVPHHDPDAAAGLAVTFDDPDRAERFAGAQGVDHIWHSGRHIYENWESVLNGRTHHPCIDPYRWSHGRTPGSDACPTTLDILKRTCNIRLSPDIPMPVLRRFARKMAAT